jgi:hypothetical protein
MMANNNDLRLNGINPLSYLGVNPRTPVPFFSRAFDPTSSDYSNFILGTIWLNTTTEDIWMLVSKADQVAIWVMLCICGTTAGITITGDTGGPLTGTSFIFTGGATGLSFNGAGSTFTLTFSGITANNGDVSLGTDAADFAINIGTDATIGRTINIGDTIGSTSINKLVGGNYTVDGNGSSNYTVFPSVTSGNILIGGTAQSGLILLDGGNVSNTMNIGVGTGTTMINIGTGSASNPISIGADTSRTASVDLNIGGANVTMTGVASVVVANKEYVTINTVTGQLGSDLGPTDSLVLIQTLLGLSGVTSVAFTTGITSAYNNYLLVMNSIDLSSSVTALNKSMIAQISVDGGATYITTGYGFSAIGLFVFEVSVGGGGPTEHEVAGSSTNTLSNFTSGSGYVSNNGSAICSDITTPSEPAEASAGGIYLTPSTIVNAFRITTIDGTALWSAQSISLYGYIS